MHKPIRQSVSQNVNVWAETSKRKPKQSTSENSEMRAKPVKQAKIVKYKLKR